MNFDKIIFMTPKNKRFIHHFIKHLARNLVMAIAAIIIALCIGIVGYHYFEGMSWVDAFLNASMILSGMGPVTHLQTMGGKIFAGCYAIFSGLMFIAVLGLILSPVFHQIFLKIKVDT